MAECESIRKCGTRKALAARFWAKVDKRGPDECWEWQAGFRRGYGRIGAGGDKGRVISAHRVAWNFAYGEISGDLCVCHHCDNRKCVNPSHLFLGTQAENIQDRHRKGRDARGVRYCPTIIPDSAIPGIRVSTESQRILARRFGVSQTLIYYIKSGRNRTLA